jgi:hypothetical protein
MSKSYLSKSRIIAGRQCEKRLWLEVHRPELLDYDDSIKYRFDMGNRVNDVARSQYPGGVLIEYERGTTEALKETKRLLAEQPDTPIFEATFKASDVLVRTDILQKKHKHYELIEVKSSTEMKDYHVEDCAVQTWVVDNTGLPLKEITLGLINNQFVYPGQGDYQGLFKYEPMTTEVRALQPEIGKWVKRYKRVLAEEEPKIEMGAQCHTPYDCPFIKYCAGPQSGYPVDCLPGSSKVKDALKAEGIRDIRDIPARRLKNDKQEWVRRVTLSGKPELRPGAKQAISGLPHPRYYLDFETTAFAVPIWAGTRPYQTLPFQWSCHIEDPPGKFRHAEFIDCSGQPPMRPFIESFLKALGTKGPIFIYSNFEKTRLNELAVIYPDVAEKISKVVNRCVDLLAIARENYYHPDMRGSWSIKYVVPTIAPQINYQALGEIQDGGAAQFAYIRLLEPDMLEEEKERLHRNLLEYCKLDTLATVELVKFFSSGKVSK